jgi:hypothetical protein
MKFMSMLPARHVETVFDQRLIDTDVINLRRPTGGILATRIDLLITAGGAKQGAIQIPMQNLDLAEIVDPSTPTTLHRLTHVDSIEQRCGMHTM